MIQRGLIRFNITEGYVSSNDELALAGEYRKIKKELEENGDHNLLYSLGSVISRSEIDQNDMKDMFPLTTRFPKFTFRFYYASMNYSRMKIYDIYYNEITLVDSITHRLGYEMYVEAPFYPDKLHIRGEFTDFTYPNTKSWREHISVGRLFFYAEKEIPEYTLPKQGYRHRKRAECGLVYYESDDE